MKLLSTILLIFISLQVDAKLNSQSFQFENYEKAIEAANYIKFDMESTKAGMITTGFTGAVKKFDVHFDFSNGVLSNCKIDFKVEQMDTDVDGRNEKMHDLCFEKTKFPEIVVDLGSQKLKIGSEHIVKGQILARGKTKPISIKVKAEQKGNVLSVTGSSQVKLTELEIPDPSIWIASVRDEVDLSFKLDLAL